MDEGVDGTFGCVKFFRRNGHEFARKKPKQGCEHVLEGEMRWHMRLGVLKTYEEVSRLMRQGESLVRHGCLVSFSMETNRLWTPRAVGPLSDPSVRMHIIHNFPSSAIALYSILVDLHRCGVSHNDLSANNVVMTASREFALIDLATIKEHHGQPCNDCTLATQPPEGMMFLPSLYVSPAHYKSDVWSMACIIAMVVNNGLYPFADPSWETKDWVMSNVLTRIYHSLGIPTVVVDPQNTHSGLDCFGTIDQNVQPHTLPHNANCRAINLINSIKQQEKPDSDTTKGYMNCPALERPEDIEVAHGIFDRGICYFAARSTAEEVMDYIWKKMESNRAHEELKHLREAANEALSNAETDEEREEIQNKIDTLAKLG
jgi:serine/threonine protein kinase